MHDELLHNYLKEPYRLLRLVYSFIYCDCIPIKHFSLVAQMHYLEGKLAFERIACIREAAEIHEREQCRERERE